MDMSGSPVNDRCDSPDVRFPFSIAASAGVTDLDAKRNALAAIFTFSQLLHLLECDGFSDSATNISRTQHIMQAKYTKIVKTLNKR